MIGYVIGSCSSLPGCRDAAIDLFADGGFDTARAGNSERNLANMLGRDLEPPSYRAVKPIEGGGVGDFGADSLRVVTLVQVETPEYESNHTTAFISGQEVFSVRGKDQELGLIASKIRNLRKSLKLRQEDFAERLRLDQTTVSKWEGEKARPTPEAMVSLASLASGTDKLFFLEKAGLPKEYLLGEPMIPGILDASHRVVADAIGASAGRPRVAEKPRMPEAKSMIDRKLLAMAIVKVQREMTKRRVRLSAQAYADAIVVLYEFRRTTGKWDFSEVGRALKIAS